MTDKARILLVDDTPANLHTLSRALGDEYDLIIATSGATALELVARTPPHLILLDVMMPEMDGFETLRHLRATPASQDIPVILLTADDRSETQVSGLQQGANDFIAKPFVVPVLKARVRNLLARHAAEEKLRQAASVFAHANEGIMITDPQGNIVDVNAAFTRITGYPRDEVLGCSTRILKSGRQDAAFYATLWKTLLACDAWSGEIWNRHKNGSVYAELLTISAIRDASGRLQRYVALLTDINAQKEYQRHLERIAHYDVLTGLPNRLLFADRLRQAMTQATRRNTHLAIVFIDLDGFKAINDTHGHDPGDRLLMAIANRLGQALREGDTLARIGGDEFVAILGDLPDAASAAPILERLLDAAAQPVTDTAGVLQVSASLGVSLYPQGQPIHSERLLRQADLAMYAAKQAGKNCYRLFEAQLDMGAN